VRVPRGAQASRVRSTGATSLHRISGSAFMLLARETGTPIVPVAVIGRRMSRTSCRNFDSRAKLFDMPEHAESLRRLLLPFVVLPLPPR